RAEWTPLGVLSAILSIIGISAAGIWLNISLVWASLLCGVTLAGFAIRSGVRRVKKDEAKFGLASHRYTMVFGAAWSKPQLILVHPRVTKVESLLRAVLWHEGSHQLKFMDLVNTDVIASAVDVLSLAVFAYQSYRPDTSLDRSAEEA